MLALDVVFFAGAAATSFPTITSVARVIYPRFACFGSYAERQYDPDSISDFELWQAPLVFVGRIGFQISIRISITARPLRKSPGSAPLR